MPVDGLGWMSARRINTLLSFMSHMSFFLKNRSAFFSSCSYLVCMVFFSGFLTQSDHGLSGVLVLDNVVQEH